MKLEYLKPRARIVHFASITGNFSPGFTRYQWSTGDTTATISLDSPGTYSLRARTPGGCDMFWEREIKYAEGFGDHELCYVDFDTITDQYLISFDPAQNEYIEAYQLWRIDSGKPIARDSILAGDIPQFYFTADATSLFGLFIVDVCGVAYESANMAAFQQPVFLTVEVENSNQINLQWNPYLGREVDHYEVWLLQENAPDIFVDSVDAGTNNFMHLNGPTGLLKYYIRTFFTEEISCHPDSNSNASVISNVASLLYIRPVTSQVNTAIHVFPNPTRGRITLGGNIIGDVQVIDVTGKELLSLKEVNKIDLKDLKSGIYYLRVISGDQSSIQRVVKI